eukprot:CAMPEP_0119054054 /NCGR_PEP_ID=MMETSP1177-20130426/74818_1 /TAXON_ID=2985 /ORGANISM="Ochromonas sp, Strain CCMP1899" /LENGTH=831 /DNA_ID=CAMNT_0007034171 /DNA_START=215 /DNA_END=2710 /DNA_ORIENTATION=+
MLMTGLDFDHSQIISSCTSVEDDSSFHEPSLEFVFDNDVDIHSESSSLSEGGSSSQGLNMAHQLRALNFGEKRSRTNSYVDEEGELSDGSSLEFIFDDDDRSYPVSPVASPTHREVNIPFQIDLRASYIMYESRFREFMTSIIQLTQWECAELWLVSKKPLSSELYVASSIHKDDTLEKWSNLSRDIVLQKGEDLPGTVFETTKSKWDKHYSSRTSKKNKTVNPRAYLASKLGMSAAFGIPVPNTSGSIGGVLALYSRSQIKPDQLLRSLVQKCVHLMIPCVSVCPDRSCLDAEPRELELLSEVSEGDEGESSVYENPYSFFCSADQSDPSSPVSTTPPLDLSTVSPKNCTEISTIFDSIPKTYCPPFQQTLQGKRGWDQEGSTGPTRSTSMPNVSQFRSIFHSQSLSSMTTAGDEATEYDYDPKAKRARSIDLGAISNETLPYDYFAPAAVLGKQDLITPKNKFNHLDMLWNSFIEPYGSDSYPYPHSTHYPNTTAFPYQLPEVPKDMPNNPYNFSSSYDNYSSDKNDNHPLFSHVSVYPTTQPVAVPSAPALNSQVICQQPSPGSTAPHKKNKSAYQSNDIDAFNSLDYVFKADFGLEQDSYCPPDGMNAPYPPCRVEGCDVDSSHRTPFCVVHATGGRRCQQQGCNKCAQGSTCYCIAHGGGRRCTFAGCSKGARDKFFCAGHGGGKRCMSSDCTKSAVGGSKFCTGVCTGHGGGKRCKIDGCDKSAQSSTLHCVKHGGGRKCSIEKCTKVARGKTDCCAAHGGGARCRTAHCYKAAVGRYQYCRPHYSAIHGSECASKMTEEEDDYMEDEEMSGCGDCSTSASITAA